MKIKQYRTPKLREFHVGFEFEHKEGFLDGTVKTQEQYESAQWIKRTMMPKEFAAVNRALNGRNSWKGMAGIRVEVK